MTEPTLGGSQQRPSASRPVPPPPPEKAAGGGKKPKGNGATAAAPPGETKPEQASAPAAKPQEPKAKEPQKIKAVADKAAVALAIGGVEEQLTEWWPILEQHILNTGGEKGGTVTFKISIEPDADMGLRARVGSSFSGSSLKRTWQARIREDKDGEKQLELFTG